MTLKRASIDMLFAVGGLAIIAALFLPTHKTPEAPVAVAPVEVAVQAAPKAAPPVVPARPSREQLVDPLFSSGAEARNRATNMELLVASADIKLDRPDPAIRVSRGPSVDSRAPRVTAAHPGPNVERLGQNAPIPDCFPLRSLGQHQR